MDTIFHTFQIKMDSSKIIFCQIGKDTIISGRIIFSSHKLKLYLNRILLCPIIPRTYLHQILYLHFQIRITPKTYGRGKGLNISIIQWKQFAANLLLSRILGKIIPRQRDFAQIRFMHNFFHGVCIQTLTEYTDIPYIPCKSVTYHNAVITVGSRCLTKYTAVIIPLQIQGHPASICSHADMEPFLCL